MPQLAPCEPDSGEWRALVEITRETVRPGSLRALAAELPDALAPSPGDA